MADLPKFTVTMDPKSYKPRTRLDDYELHGAQDITASVDAKGRTLVTLTIPVHSATIDAWLPPMPAEPEPPRVLHFGEEPSHA